MDVVFRLWLAAEGVVDAFLFVLDEYFKDMIAESMQLIEKCE